MWFLTVCSEIRKRLPICLFEDPLATRQATSYSREVRACMNKSYTVQIVPMPIDLKIYEIRTSSAVLPLEILKRLYCGDFLFREDAKIAV